MDETSAMFGEQARADLRTAQLIPQHDLSGQALGLSMFHAQQCIEKQLKSIVLRLNEALKLEEGDGFLFELSHKFYPSLHNVRSRFVQKMGMPPKPILRLIELDPGEQAFARNERLIAHLGEFWEKYSRPCSLFSVSMWKHSMHVRLSEDEHGALGEFFDVDAAALAKALGRLGVDGSPKVQLGDYSVPPPMRDVIGDRDKTESTYMDHRNNQYRQVLQLFQDYHAARQDRIFSDTALERLGGIPVDGRVRAVKRLVAEFAFEAVSSQAYRYAPLFPHNIVGRYPMRLPGGGTTTGVYASKPDVVLHWVYNEARLNFDMLCEHASKLDELCGLGHEHGYW